MGHTGGDTSHPLALSSGANITLNPFLFDSLLGHSPHGKGDCRHRMSVKQNVDGLGLTMPVEASPPPAPQRANRHSPRGLGRLR